MSGLISIEKLVYVVMKDINIFLFFHERNLPKMVRCIYGQVRSLAKMAYFGCILCFSFFILCSSTLSPIWPAPAIDKSIYSTDSLLSLDGSFNFVTKYSGGNEVVALVSNFLDKAALRYQKLINVPTENVGKVKYCTVNVMERIHNFNIGK